MFSSELKWIVLLKASMRMEWEEQFITFRDKNAGYESGYINTGAQMDYITIVTLDESTDLITAFPSFGDYHK